MIAVTSTVKTVLIAIVTVWGIIGANAARIAVRDWWRRGGRDVDRIVSEEAPRPPATETRPGAGLWCLWCHPTRAGHAGRCGCTSRCEDVEQCIGDYTALGSPEFTAQLEAMLNEDGQR